MKEVTKSAIFFFLLKDRLAHRLHVLWCNVVQSMTDVNIKTTGMDHLKNVLNSEIKLQSWWT
jgi:hypothetical protein